MKHDPAPGALASSMSFSAFAPWPWPSESDSSRTFRASLYLSKPSIGSEPGEKTNTSGVTQVESA